MSGNSQSVVIMIVLLVVMYLMLIRPQNKKEKADREMRSKLQVGDEIMTVGGIYGKVVRIREDRITIASGAEKTKIEITKTAVSTVITDKPAPTKQAVEEEKKSATPKSIKKLGAKKEEAPATEAPVETEAAPEAEAPVETEAAPEAEAPAEE